MKSRSMIRMNPDAGPSQVIRQHGAQGPAPADRDPALQQRTLAGFPELRKTDLAAIPVKRLQSS